MAELVFEDNLIFTSIDRLPNCPEKESPTSPGESCFFNYLDQWNIFETCRVIIFDHIWDEPWSCYAELTPPSGWWVASATPQKKSRRSCWTLKIILAHFSDKTHINKKGSIWRWKKKSTKMKTWKPRWVVSTLSFHEWLHHPWKNWSCWLSWIDKNPITAKKRFLISKLMRYKVIFWLVPP